MLYAVMFDFDGVIIDSEPVHLRCFREVIQDAFDVTFTDEEYYTKYLPYTDAEAFRMILEDNNRQASDEQLNKLIQDKAALVNKALEDAKPLPGAIELMKAVKEADLGLAIVSGALRDEIDQAGAAVGALEYADVIISAENVRRGKPEPEAYETARKKLIDLRGLFIPPGACVAIEDSPGGIQAGKAAEMNVLGVATTLPAEKLTEADKVVANLGEVTIEDIRAMTKD